MAKDSFTGILIDASIPAMEARALAVALDDLVYQINGGRDLTEDRLDILYALVRSLRRTCARTVKKLDPHPKRLKAAAKIEAAK